MLRIGVISLRQDDKKGCRKNDKTDNDLHYGSAGSGSAGITRFRCADLRQHRVSNSAPSRSDARRVPYFYALNVTVMLSSLQTVLAFPDSCPKSVALPAKLDQLPVTNGA
jgi:hypothetical protein